MALFPTELDATSDPSHTAPRSVPPITRRRPQIKLVLRSRPRLSFCSREKEKKEAKGLVQGHTAQLVFKTRSSDPGKSTILPSAGTDSVPLTDGTMPIQGVHTLNQKINQQE